MLKKLKQELMKYELVPEEWGGDTIYVPISAKTHQNIDQLLRNGIISSRYVRFKSKPIINKLKVL